MRSASWLGVLPLLIPAAIASAAERPEDLVRSLEQAQMRAVLARDRATLERVLADDFVVTNPLGVLLRREEALVRLTQGDVSYRSYAHETELVRVLGDVVVTAGRETVVPAQGPQSGQTIERRYTQVWKREKIGWRVTVRHASVIPEG